MTKAHYHRQFNFALDSVDDADIIERIASQPSQIAYLRNLIRRDIRYERENARLQELVDYMTPIAIYGASEQERDRMRRLGIEVPR